MVLGIDPGLSGGVAVLDGTTLLNAVDIPVNGEKAKRRVDVRVLLDFLAFFKVEHAFIERAQAMPSQGSSSGFNYGRAVGALEAAVACSNLPLTLVEPAVWKRKLGLPGGEQHKETARQRAIQLFPGMTCFARKMDHGRAEAALIAYYGLRYLL